MVDGQREYYEEDLNKLRNRVDKCSIDILDSMIFFLKEADAYSYGIDKDIESEIENEVSKFKKNCRSEKRFP